MFKKLFWAVPALLALCGGAFAGFGSGAPAQEVARESLELLKTMAPRSSTAHTYIGTCVTAIAHAKRMETRKDTAGSSLQAIWVQAAGRCRGMANTVCDLSALEAPREACNRIRGFEPVVLQ
jgi:hypothetical protein